jgi:integrase
MPRRGGIWWRESKNAWYTTLHGRQIRLAEGKDNKEAAHKGLARLQAGLQLDEVDLGGAVVGSLCAAFLTDAKRRYERGELAEKTLRTYGEALGQIVNALGDVPAKSLRPYHVTAWLDRHPKWTPTTRHTYFSRLRCAMRWARRTGRIENNPLEYMTPPRKVVRRQEVINYETAQKVVERLNGPAKAFFGFLLATGCRIGEAARVEAKDIDWERGIATLERHKSAYQTGKLRTIALSPEAQRILREQVARYPKGPVFRTSHRNPWTSQAAKGALKSLKDEMPAGLMPHAFRHAFATNALRTLPPATVAALLGHSSVAMLRVYDRTGEQVEQLVNAVRTLGPSPTPPASPTRGRRRGSSGAG